MTDLKSKTPEQLREWASKCGYPKFRADQIFAWMHRGVRNFEEMTDLPKSMIAGLKETAQISFVNVEKKFVSRLDGTVKYLYRLNDGNFIESVVMNYHHGYTICVSSQVGCRMGCTFCQSTRGGKIRDLAPAEILDQILYASHDMGITISNIVMMGIGEPLDNFENVNQFLRIVNHPKGICIGYRHISVSTCGLTEGIAHLAEQNYPITLSVSLHAPFDELRSKMMPINKKYSIAGLLEACWAYQKVTGRRISFEYTLVEGVNDSAECANELVRLLHGKLCHINLIPVNKIKDGKYSPSDKKAVLAFQNILTQKGLNATVRRTLGADISASCGQLRSKRMEKEETL